MNEQHPDTVQQITGQVQSMFYLVDESTTALTIQTDGQVSAVRAYGQIAWTSARCHAARRSARHSTMRRPTIRRSSPSCASPD